MSKTRKKTDDRGWKSDTRTKCFRVKQSLTGASHGMNRCLILMEANLQRARQNTMATFFYVKQPGNKM